MVERNQYIGIAENRKKFSRNPFFLKNFVTEEGIKNTKYKNTQINIYYQFKGTRTNGGIVFSK